MVVIPDPNEKIPMMFRAQIGGRCQLQRLIPGADEQDAGRWASEWVEETYPHINHKSDNNTSVQNRTYQLSWRFVTNSGQDETIIRPVIGAKGWPYYPGSSMKGIFRRACTKQEADLYCGKSLPDGDFIPGILRFHGGYPTSTQWTNNLVDIVHPQQNLQVKGERDNGAFIQISLYKPELKFSISSNRHLETFEWEKIWNIWEKALSTGIGCRVSAGYGQPEKHSGNIIYRTRIKGRGQAAKLVTGEGEFRPNIFKAAIRGHALRIFGGLTDSKTADRIVENLFGGVSNGATVGFLAMSFRDSYLDTPTFGIGAYATTAYDVEGELVWLLNRPLNNPQHKEILTKLIANLTQFAMIFGGFGKSWRRADHRLFYEEYYEHNRKPLIGCHWQWIEERSLLRDVRVRKLEDVKDFIDKLRQTAQEWMQIQGINSNPNQIATNWREVWHQNNVQIWGRVAGNQEDSLAIDWFHGPYEKAIPRVQQEGSIYRSLFAGRMGNIGRIWHRMYPFVRLLKNPEDPKKPIPKTTSQYLEFLTIFPDDSSISKEFLQFLNSEATSEGNFQRLW
jgi:CRISPR-associated protein Cmr6